VRVKPGKPFPLGANCEHDGVNFAIFSANAEKVELCVFDPTGMREVARYPLPGKTHDVWHAFLPDLPAGTLYGFRVYGPYNPPAGHRFNHHKLLLDPYARALHGRYVRADENHGYTIGHPDGDLSFDRRDNAKFVPKSVVCAKRVGRAFEERPSIPMLDSIIYEGHVKGLTQNLSNIKSAKRGTYAALASKSFIRHLKDLGVTSLELLPIHAFTDEPHLAPLNLVNYWGYNSLSFFVPEGRYGENDPVRELRRAIRTLHGEGIEVLLDVVYNHTAEGNELGPTLCYRGIDNASYYRLLDDNPRYYLNDSGCGNTVNCSNPRVIQLIMDSLRYWVSEMNVDGFRFDLAPVLGRETHGFDRGAGLLDAIAQDPTLAGTKLIAEPWDCGMGGYQLGQFPKGWSEWNDKFRDVVRGFWNGQGADLQSLSKALHGSSEIFEWQSRGPAASINMISAHDGFTLADLVSYESRHNEANGENNSDGHSHNLSCNYGVEGPTEDESILAARNLHRRNLMTSLVLSQGVPMLLAGDEFGRTQQGNNNAYCQDNEINWVDWSLRKSDDEFFQFTRKLISLRKECAVFRRNRYLHGREVSPTLEYPDIQWFTADGVPMASNDWHNHDIQFVAMLLAGDVGDFTDQDGEYLSSDSVCILINKGPEAVTFPLPAVAGQWRLRVDTARPANRESSSQKNCVVAPHSMAVCTLTSPVSL